MGLRRHREIKSGIFSGHVTILLASTIAVAICASIAFLLLANGAAQMTLPRDTLWEVVHNLCVPGESEHQNPTPCVSVNLEGGPEKGFAIIRDPRGGAQFLLIPITRISGIESPIVRGANAANYFASAWESRNYIDDALHLKLSRDEVGLAINSSYSRTQDQLHIHFSCVQPDVWKALHKNEDRIGGKWAPFKPPLFGHSYEAMWVLGDNLSALNPFRILAETLPHAAEDMAGRTLVVIGVTRADGVKGFFLLTDRADAKADDTANGEELLDHSCQITAMGGRAGATGANR